MTSTIVFSDKTTNYIVCFINAILMDNPPTTLPFLDVTLRIRDGWKSFLTKNHLPLYKFDQFFYTLLFLVSSQ